MTKTNSRSKKLLGVASLLPFAYTPFFLIICISYHRAMTAQTPTDLLLVPIRVFLGIHLAYTIGWGVLVIQFVILLRKGDIADSQLKLFWGIGFVLLPQVSMPLYWYLHVREV